MNSKEPLIFDIQRGSTVDGPGVRTTVFFKGCNLRCRWCHNPESQSPYAQLAFFKHKCVGCGLCREVCSSISCVACGKCADYCLGEARKLYGKQYSAEELFEIIRQDEGYYRATGGGVTFSGGECMLYPDFVLELGRLCKSAGINVAVDTAGCVPFSSFEKVLPVVDLFLYDVKCLGADLHEQFTGKRNELILENLDKLIESGKKVRVRVPIVPYFNQGEEEEKIRRFLLEKGLEADFLACHDMGESKKTAILDAEK